MTRKEAYAKIKELGLQSEVEKMSGKNYTQTSTEILEKVIWNYDATLADRDCGDDVVVTGRLQDAETGTVVEYTTTDTNDAYEAACIAFVGILKDSGKLEEILAKL